MEMNTSVISLTYLYSQIDMIFNHEQTKYDLITRLYKFSYMKL